MRILLVSGVFTLMAYAVLRGLWPALRTRRGGGAFLAAALAVHAGVVLGRALDLPWLTVVTRSLLVAWFVAALLSIAAGLPLRLVGWIQAWRARRPQEREAKVPLAVDTGRRAFLSGMVVPVTAASVGAGGTASALTGFVVRHEEVPLPGLPPSLNGLRIGQLTDVHVGDFIDPEYLARAVDALDAEGVALQVQTGDLIDDMEQLAATLDALERCRAPLGMVSILGNHEKWRDEAAVIAGFAAREPRGRLRLLRDESVVLTHQGQPFRVVGVDYPMRPGGRHRLPAAERQAMMSASAEKAWRGVQPDETVLCLTHHPDFFRHAAERGAQLTLAGHTHGGQVGLWRIPLFSFAFEHILGRYRRGGSQLYVSGGTGHWLPYRVGIPAEVTVLTLRRA